MTFFQAFSCREFYRACQKAVLWKGFYWNDPLKPSVIYCTILSPYKKINGNRKQDMTNIWDKSGKNILRLQEQNLHYEYFPL